MTLSIRRSLQGVLLALSLMSFAAMAVDFLSIRSLSSSIHKLEADEITHLATLKSISDSYAVTIVDTTHKIADGSMSWAEGYKTLASAQSKIEASWAKFTAVDLEADEKKVVLEFEGLMKNSQPALLELLSLVKAENSSDLQAFRKSKLYPTIDPLTEKVDFLVQFQLDEAKKSLKEAEATGTIAKSIGLVIGVSLLLMVAFGFFIVEYNISAPLSRLKCGMLALSGGTIDQPLKEVGLKNEIGEMARAVDIFRDNVVERRRLEAKAADERDRELRRQTKIESLIEHFRGTIGDIRSTLDREFSTLREVSSELSDIASQAAEGANTAQDASEDSSTNVQTVAKAAGELTSASREISEQVHRAGECVTRANDVARAADEDVSSLADLADRIGAIVDIISSIAEQTNMLALNATIEAARAGEAGRSFAVVASEVKTLAGQTAKATDEISAQVRSIQQATQTAVLSIRTITGNVSEIEGRTTAIAAAVEEQEASTHEISKSIALASDGSHRVTTSVVSVSSAVEHTSKEAQRMLVTTDELMAVAGNLTRTVDEFLRNVTDDVQERRTATRHASRQAVVIEKSGRRQHTHLADISNTGAKIEVVSSLKLGEEIELEWITGERTICMPVWINGGYAGLAFKKPIGDALLKEAA